MSKPRCYTFLFESEEASHLFLEYAKRLESATLVTHPFTNSVLVKKKVLVRGSGCLTKDFDLRDALETKANELGGVVVP